MFSKTIISAILVGAANAHLVISKPVPIPGSNGKPPLDPSGSNFPCQGADLTQGTVTPMAVGSSQPLQWDLGNGANWAVHGGGSCQISVTYETEKAKQKDPANWKVIHSFLGGCPTNTKLNLDGPGALACTGSNNPDCVNQGLQFEIPKEVKNGAAILAWTWFNNVGNREMYMNCAKVNFSGGSNQVDTLPSLFTANIGNGCTTVAYKNTQFPNPGKYITSDSNIAANYPLAPPSGSCGTTSAVASTSSSSGAADTSDSDSSASSGSSTDAAPAAASSASSSGSGRGGKGSGRNPGTFAEGAAAAVPATTLVPQAAPTAAASTAGSGACANGGVSCSASGFYCIDANTFGMCAFGCAIPQPVAAGTSCSSGAIARAVTRRNNRLTARRSLMGQNL